MKLKIILGHGHVGIDMDWPKELNKFPVVIHHWHRNWEWICHQKSAEYGIDEDLTFAEVKTYDPRANESHHPTLDSLLVNAYPAQVGCAHEKATYTGFQEVYDYCRKCEKKL